jgi:hypothetical protein
MMIADSDACDHGPETPGEDPGSGRGVRHLHRLVRVPASLKSPEQTRQRMTKHMIRQTTEQDGHPTPHQ